MGKIRRYVKNEKGIVGDGDIRIVIPVSRNMLHKMNPEKVWQIVREDAVAAARIGLQDAYLEERGLIWKPEGLD